MSKTSNIVIRSVTKSILDIFHGTEGWEQWTRVKIEHGRGGDIIVHPKKGVPFSKQAAQEVFNYVHSNTRSQ